MKPDSTIKEKSLNPHPKGRPQTQALAAAEKLDERVLQALHAASEKKAIDLVVLDLQDIASFTDYFVITSGANERQVQAIADGVSDTLKKVGSPAARVEGYKAAEWILLDYGDFIVHVFEQKARSFYDLERLWRESKRVELPAELNAKKVSSLRRES
jgi:ribosome-associated protein